MAAIVTEHTINTRALLQGKLGAKFRFVPEWLVRWLKKTIHEDEVNKYLWDSRHLTGTEWLADCVRYLDARLVVEGMENLPDDSDGRRFTFVSNHPLGGADGVALGSIIGQRYDSRFRYLVNDLLMNLPGLAPLCVPINKTGKQGRDFPRMVEACFRSDYHVLMFPAGLCSRKIDGKIQDLPWTKTFISKSIQTQRDVIPIHFSGRNSDKFYRIANIAKALRLKFNPAMLFLVDEMYRNVHNTFTITIGKPIPWQTFDKSKSPTEWAQYVRQQVYQL